MTPVLALPCVCSHRPRLLLARRARGRLDDLQYGEGKGGRLARARLRGGNDVASGKHLGDGLCLDGGWRGEAEGTDAFKDVLVEPELGKVMFHDIQYRPTGPFLHGTGAASAPPFADGGDVLTFSLVECG